MPDTPTPCVNGQLLPLQPCSSISSLLPATSTPGAWASTAMAGSFCLFCEKGVGGLPLVTFASLPAPMAVVAVMSANRAATGIAESFVISFPHKNHTDDDFHAVYPS